MPADHSSSTPASDGAKKRPDRPTKPAGAAKTAPRKREPTDPDAPGASRLYTLLAGALLCMLGVGGFLYDASFETGSRLSSDYFAGTLLLNGWRNVLYLLSGLLALGFATRKPRASAFGIGALYLTMAIWGFIVVDHGVGDIVGVLPLSDDDNVFHLILGVLGIAAVLMDGARPQVPARIRKLVLPKPKRKRPRKRLPEKPSTPTSSSPSSSA